MKRTTTLRGRKAFSSIEAPSKWSRLADNMLPHPVGDVLWPTDVLQLTIASREYEGYGTFWEAYHAYRGNNLGKIYGLSPVNVIFMEENRSPTSLYIMFPDDWPRYYDFKRRHTGEYRFSH